MASDIVKDKALHTLIAGGVAGCSGVLVGHPFDTYKVRLQTSTSLQLNKLRHITSLYRGIGPPMTTFSFVKSLGFSSYTQACRWWNEYFEGDAYNIDDKYPRMKYFVCGAFAGFMQAFVNCPSDHVKCRLQIEKKTQSTMLDTASKILSSHGLRGLYRGFPVQLCRETPSFGLYFASYDINKDFIASNIIPKSDTPGHRTLFHNWITSALAGGFSGVISWTAIYPLDAIKTRIQTAPLDLPLSQRQAHVIFLQMIREHGWTSLYRGLGVALVRAFPVNATILPVYEFTLGQLRRC